MNSEGRNKIIKSLAVVIDEWLVDQDLNNSSADDIGYVSNNTAELMARAAVLILESNSDSQTYAVDEGYLKE